MYRFFFLGALFLLMGCNTEEVKIAHEDPLNPIENAQEMILNLSEQNISNFTPYSLERYKNCEELAHDLKETALTEMRARLAKHRDDLPDYPDYPDYDDTDAINLAPAPIMIMPGMPRGNSGVGLAPMPTEGIDFSGTNNQERGIDEADIIKTDGRYFYLLNKSKFQILKIEADGGLSSAGEIMLSYPGSGILLMDDIAIVLSEYDWQSAVRIDMIDLGSTREHPKIIDTHFYQGKLLAARKVGNNIHVASYFSKSLWLDNWPKIERDFYKKSHEEKLQLWEEAIAKLEQENEDVINKFDFLSTIPQRLNHVNGNTFSHPSINDNDCALVHRTHDSSSEGMVSLITLNPNEEATSSSMQWVRSNQPIVYASADQFVLASPEYTQWWHDDEKAFSSQTAIHRFKMNADNNSVQYADSVRIPGTLHNSFSLSEYEGYLRVVTTTKNNLLSDWTVRNEENHLFILGDKEGKMEIISSLQGLARGETIWSARFSKDKGFLVTFRQIDPLFTLDLSDPKNPQVAGELKVPGVSTYLQDIGDGHLLAIGYGGDEEGLDFQTSISLFDVSDFGNPKLADSLSFGPENNGYVYSEANQDHLAINYFAPLGLTAIPISINLYTPNPLNFFEKQLEYITKLVLVNTTAERDISILGEIDHSPFYDNWRSGTPQIRRSYFVGDYVYAISPNVITATRLSDMGTTGMLNLH